MHVNWRYGLTLLVIILASCFLAVLLFFIYKMYQHPQVNFANPEFTPKKIVFLGDSHVHGRIGNDFVTALQTEVPYFEMINLGQNGDTVDDLLQRIDRAKEVLPQQIYILIGSNDVLECDTCSTPPPDFHEQYKQLVESLTAIAKVYLISIPMMGDKENDVINTKIKAYNDVIANISALSGAKYLPLHEKMAATINALKPNKRPYDHPYFSRGLIVGMRRYLLGHELSSIAVDYGFALTVDGLHLNEEGSQILMSLILPELPTMTVENE